MRLINIGFGNLVSSERLLTIVGPDSAPIKRMIQEARDRAMLIDASYGRKTRAVLLMDTDHVILSAVKQNRITGETLDAFVQMIRSFSGDALILGCTEFPVLFSRLPEDTLQGIRVYDPLRSAIKVLQAECK